MPNGAVVAAGFQPYSLPVVDIVTEHIEKGIPIDAVTDSPVSPLARAARVAFKFNDGRRPAFRLPAAKRCGEAKG